MNSDLVFLCTDSKVSKIVYGYLHRSFTFKYIVIEKKVGSFRLVKNRLRRLGWLTVFGQILFELTVRRILKRSENAALSRLQATLGISLLDFESDVPIMTVSSVNAGETASLLKKLNPKIVVVQGTRILSPELLHSCNAIFINLHSGITPLYRGVQGGYWALVNDDPDHCGVTVHRVDEGIDTGGILAQARIQPGEGDNYATYFALQLQVGLPLMQKAIKDILSGQKIATVEAPEGKSKVWSHPTLWGYLLNRCRRGIK